MSLFGKIGKFLGGPIPGMIGTGLELFGAGKQLFGKGPPGPGGQAYQQLMGAAKAADKLGLHRLTVAGSPAGYSPAPMSQAEGLMAAGRGLRDRPSAKENDLLDAQIEEARSRTILNQANARRAMLGPQPGLGQASNRMVEAFDRLASGGERAVSGEPERDQPATQTVTLGSSTARGPNPEAFEVGISELLAGALIYGPQWAYDRMQRLVRSLPEAPPKTNPPRSSRTRTTGGIGRQRKPWEKP
jgi:hypothetical protein